MGNRQDRGSRDDVAVKLRKRRRKEADGPDEGGGGGGPSIDRCGTRRVKLIDVNQAAAVPLPVGVRLGWDSQDGRVLVVSAQGALGQFPEEDAALLIRCLSQHHRYSVIWEGNGTVLVRKEV